MSVRLVYRDIAVGAEEDASVSTTAAKSFSLPAQLPHGVDSVPIATLELNGWGLGGDREILTTQKVGFWSDQMSGENGAFSSPPTITIDFDEQYTSTAVSLVFDTAVSDYCSKVTIFWYQGETLLAQQEFHPDGPTYFCEKTVWHYSKVVIRMDATHLPYRYAKLSKIRFGIIREFLRDELRNVKITEEINLISTELPTRKMDFSLDSKTGIEYIFQRLQPIFAYDGETLIGAFYVENSNRKGKSLYDLSCNDAVGVLDYETIPAAMYSGKNAKTALLDILDDKFELDIDPELESETLTGYVPEGTRRNAVHHIAFALRAIVDTSGTDKVRVFRAHTEDPANIPPSRIYTGGSVDTSAIVTAVKVTTHSYSTTGDGNQVEVGGTTYYDTQNVITILNPNVTASDKKNVVEITDATLVNPSNGQAVTQNVYDYYMRRNIQHLKIVMDGEKPGDYVTATTPWGVEITGNVTMMNINLSGIAAADCEVVGV